MVSQNAPFLPMYEAWQKRTRELTPYDAEQSRQDASAIVAKVLSNRKPPYPIAGGLYDALKATTGEILQVTNDEAEVAMQLFIDTEGVDINPAAGVALASLIKEVQAGRVERNATIMLNITGGGEQRYKADKNIFYLRPDYIFPIKPNERDVVLKVEELFA